MDQHISSKDVHRKESKAENRPRGEETPSPYSYKDFNKPSETKRPSVQKRMKKVAITIAVCMLMGIVGYKYAGKLLPQSNLAFIKTTNAKLDALPPQNTSFPTINPETTRESEIAQAVEFLDLQRQNQRQVQMIRNLKDQLSNSYSRLDEMKSSLNKHKRVIATQKKEQDLEESLREQIAVAQKQLTEKDAMTAQLQERLQNLQKHSEEAQKSLNKHHQGNSLLTQRFNQVQKHLQKAQEELLEQSTENERLSTAVNALQAELTTTALRLKEKEQISDDLSKKSKILQEELVLAKSHAFQKDKELKQLNSILQGLYEEQNRLQEILTERDGMTNKLLGKVKKLKNTIEEREREAYLQALEQLSSSKHSFNRATTPRGEISSNEVDLDHYIHDKESTAEKKHASPQNLEQKQKDYLFNNLVFEEETGLSLDPDEQPSEQKKNSKFEENDFIDETELGQGSKPNTKNHGPNRKKQNQQSTKKSQPIADTSEDSDLNSYGSHENFGEKQIYKKREGANNRHKTTTLHPTSRRIPNNMNQKNYLSDASGEQGYNETYDHLNRELDLEKVKIQELEKSLQTTLSSYEETKKQMQSMQSKNSESGLSFGR